MSDAMKYGQRPFYEPKSKEDWDKWPTAEILYAEDWKPGVKKLHVRDLSMRPPQFFLVYCKDECLPPRACVQER